MFWLWVHACNSCSNSGISVQYAFHCHDLGWFCLNQCNRVTRNQPRRVPMERLWGTLFVFLLPVQGLVETKTMKHLCFAFWCNPQVTWVFSIPHRFRNLWLKVMQKLQDHDFLWSWVNSWVHLFRAPLDYWGLFCSLQLGYRALASFQKKSLKTLA